MSKTAAELREDIDFLRAECEDILDTARNDEDGPRDLTEDEQTRFDEGEAELTRLKDVLDKDEAQRARIAEFAALEPKDKQVVPQVIRSKTDEADSMELVSRSMIGDPDADRQIRDVARHALDEAFGGDADSRQAGENVVRGVTTKAENVSQAAREIVLLSTPAYRSAFGKWAEAQQGGFSHEWTPAERQAVNAVRALVGGTPAQGGLQIPTHLDPVFVVPNQDFIGGLRPFATVEVLPAGMRTYNGVASDNVSVNWIGPDVHPVTRTVPESVPTQTAIQVDTHLAAIHMTASIEYDQDVGGGANVNRYFADARAREEALVFITGDGVNKPSGIVTDLAAVASSVYAAAFSADAIEGILYDSGGSPAGLPVGYLAGARWLLHPKVASDIRGQETETVLTDQGYLPRSANLPQSILGAPASYTGAMDSDTGTPGQNVAVVGRLATYKIIDKMGAMVKFTNEERDATTGLPTGHVGWTLYYRQGGGIGSTQAGVHGPANSLRLLQIA